jgi:hypothetical protein
MRTFLLLPFLMACPKASVVPAPAGGAPASVTNAQAGSGSEGPAARYNPVVMQAATETCALEERVDINRDGRADVVKCFQQRGDSRVLVRRTSDLNNDGRFDYTALYEEASSPDDPRLKREEFDTDFDDRLDLVENYIDGKLKDTEVDTNFDGIRDLHKEYAGGVLQQRTLDTSGDGVPDVFETYKEGKPYQVCRDSDADGLRNEDTCRAHADAAF